MASTIWKGHLTFGLVSVPVKLFRAARAEKIHMHHLQRNTGARVRQTFVPVEDSAEEQPVTPTPERPQQTPRAFPAAPLETMDGGDSGTSAQVRRSDLVRGYEYEKDRYVSFEPQELENLAPKSSPDIQIVEFVHFAEVDPVYLETSYYIAPDRGGEKPYSLLFESLKKTGYAAIAEFVMHRRDQTIILRPGEHGLIGHTMFYEDEVRRDSEFRADPKLIVPKEMELAEKLVEALAAPFEPGKFKDKYRERLNAAIATKVESGVVHQAKPGATTSTPVVDIMAALRESLAKAKKPQSRETISVAGRPAAKSRKRA